MKTLYNIVNVIAIKGSIDERHAARIGRRVSFFTVPMFGRCLLMDYEPRKGEEYEGVLRTSKVQEVVWQGACVMVRTQNSTYVFEEEGK